MFSKLRNSLVVAIGSVALVPAALAIPIEDRALLNPAGTVIDFESFANGTQSAGPLTIGDATFSTGRGSSIRDISQFTPTTSGNGAPQGNTLKPGTGGFGQRPYVAINVDFASAVAEVGLDWFDVNIAGSRLEVFGAGGVLLESILADTGPAGGSHADFVGVQRGSNEITSVSIIPGSGQDVYSIDNFQFFALAPPPPAPVPAPASLLLILSGLLLGRKFKKAS